ncbi:hypothetical protein DID88_006865 [Monilinia fructigena]|uniref:Uncharacterized protein n=1 Tax=Monilinia fructigena TaxID=38457 RepID=A0A395IGS8_9HELO|nr:hypothetical protein DID88_006865 [Monilinia fructigena]
MSRVTPPVTKFTQIIRRSISTTSTVASPSAQLKTQGAKADLISKLSHERTITTTHRPPPLHKNHAPHARIPHLRSPSFPLRLHIHPRPSRTSSTSFALQSFSVRVPILPDNYSASQSIKESIDTAVPRQEIHIVSAQPEEVFTAVNVLTEVVGNEGEASMDLGEWVEGMRARVRRSGASLSARMVSKVFLQSCGRVFKRIFGSKGKVAL